MVLAEAKALFLGEDAIRSEGGLDLAADRKGGQVEGPCWMIIGPLDKAPGIRDLVDPIEVDGKSLT